MKTVIFPYPVAYTKKDIVCAKCGRTILGKDEKRVEVVYSKGNIYEDYTTEITEKLCVECRIIYYDNVIDSLYHEIPYSLIYHLLEETLEIKQE